MARPALIDSNPNQYNQGFRYFPFMVSFDRCNGSCNNLDDTSGRIFVPNKTEGVNLSASKLVTRKHKSKTLKKIYYASINVCLMVENVIQIKRGMKNCVDVSAKVTKIIMWPKICIYILNPSACTYRNGKYSASVIGDSAITCNEIIEVTKNIATETVPTKIISTNFNKKKVSYKI